MSGTTNFSEVVAPSEGGANSVVAPPTPTCCSDSLTSTSASTPARKKSTGVKTPRSKLPVVPRTPQMVAGVRYCPTSRMTIDLCYQCFGCPEDGLPPILLIGGLNMQMTAWDEVFCESLVRSGFYVIRFDNRDIGHSTKIENCGKIKIPMLLLPHRAAKWLGEDLPYQLEDMAADAWALLDALHIPSAHLFGISMGGMIAQLAALQAPERTMSLTSVMSSTNAPDLPQPELWVKLWMMRRPPRNCTVEQLLEFRVDSLRHLLRYTLPPDGAYLKRRFLLSLRRSSYAAGLLRQAAAIRRASGRDALLQRLHVPALVVHGAQDIVVPPMHGYRTATMLPYARMLVLKSMGHYFHPAFFPTIIAAFADMAASTDPAKRSLFSGLSSVNATKLWSVNGDDDPDEQGEAMSETESEGGAGDLDTELAVKSGKSVDATTLMMASLGEYIVPVVADAESPIGKAVCRSVMVAVPGGNSSPAVPEAVLVENLFQRDPHAKPSLPIPTIVKRSARLLAEKSTVQRTTDSVSNDNSRIISPSPHSEKRIANPPSNDWRSSAATGVAIKPSCETKTLHAVPTPLPIAPLPVGMEGAEPFVLCSPSRWHQLNPFPRCRSPAGGSGMLQESPTCGPLVDKAALQYGTSSSPSSSSPSAGAVMPEMAACSCDKSSGAIQACVHQRFPSFHPVVAGVTVEEYLRTHKTLKECTDAVAATAVGSSAVASVREIVTVEKAHKHATAPATVTKTAEAHADTALAVPQPVPVAAIPGGVMESVTSILGETIHRPIPECTHTGEGLTDEAFLHSEAPQNVVDASSFAAL